MRRMKTDLERLHDVALKENHGPREGKTFYDCHLVAGALELENEEVIIWLPSLRSAKHIKPMLKKVLQDHDISIASKPNRNCWILDNNSRIIFACGNINGYSHDSAVVTFW